jgi:hypothetical protein
MIAKTDEHEGHHQEIFVVLAAFVAIATYRRGKT